MPARTFPRWAILLIDMGICLAALTAAYQLRFNFHVPAHEVDLLLPVLPIYVLVRFLSFRIAGIHRGMVRYTNTDDAKRIFLTVLAGSAFIALLSVGRYFLYDHAYVLPFSILIIDSMGAMIGMIAARIAVKLLYLRSKGSGKNELRVLIYGAGEAGAITKRTLEREGSARYRVEAFVDDDPKKAGKRLEGAVVLSTAQLAARLSKGDIDQVIIAIMSPDPEARRRVVDACVHARVPVLRIPPVSDWINGQLSSGQLRQVRIEDLLGRPVILLDDARLRQRLAGKRVLVTGAAGSIGGELVHQLLGFGCEGLVLVDIAESPLYDLEMELATLRERFRVVIADVRDPVRMERIFAEHRPEMVFHAAAYKHVPLMEAQPREAVRTNIGGTRTVADLAAAYGVAEFVLVSTDKAVNPTNVMGASKRIAEMYVATLTMDPTIATRFVTTRFGNVLGSSGSVIPLFRRQIAAGGPVTVTHPEVTRFFMTIPEACRLVLEAAMMGQGGEIYVFDMGEPVRIADLAERMIRLSGFEPHIDIPISYSGLRPGEKLYEELLATQENTLPTHHPRILIGKVQSPGPGAAREIAALVENAVAGTPESIVSAMKRLVPEYRSQNSVYANLDAPSAAGNDREDPKNENWHDA
ncbi:MAG: polysaccharide biosynthesis protein [Flavobacteriales bacterium]|nr:polysaccharide biosynthesis protein [Flavobacteriales bacterium]MCB9168230.1 polysaccharide biosynthesis protein [Flavobacteriales bacterium]